MSHYPLLRRKTIAAFATESLAGTAATLTAGDANFNVWNFQIQPKFDIAQREAQGSFAMLPSVVQGKLATATFQTELYADSTSPAMTDVLFPAVGLGWASTKYQLDSLPIGAPATTQRTVTIGGYYNGLFVHMYGCMGNAKFTFDASKRVLIDWTFEGIYGGVIDASALSATFPTTAPLKFLDGSVTLGSWTPSLQQIVLETGNTLYTREDANEESGYSCTIITNRQAKLTLNPESTLVVNHDVWGDFEDGAEFALSFAAKAGTASATFAATKASVANINGWEDRNGVLINTINVNVNSDDLSATFVAAQS